MNKQKVNLQKWNITYKFGNCKFFQAQIAAKRVDW